MSRTSLMLALAAVSLGTVALSSSDASAFGRSYLGGGAARVSGPAHLSGPVRLNSPVHLGPSTNLHLNNYVAHANLKPVLGIVIKPPHHHHWWWSHWRFGWERPYWIAPAVATGAVAAGTVASYASTPATTNPCSCLTKQYTPQGAVVFKDVCTNEMAMNPPDNPAQGADTGPQEPQQPSMQSMQQVPQTQPMQQGYLQAQPTQLR